MMRKRLNIPNLRSLLAAVLCAVLSLTWSGTALAAQDATLTLQMSYTSGETSTPIGGVTATAYRVADLDEAVNNYTLLDDFASLGIDFNQGLDAAQMEEAALQAQSIVEASSLSGVSATSDAEGVTSFGSLPYGVYLVIQTGASGDAATYEDLTPFLISVPQITEDGVVYEVLANPKTAPKPPTPEPPTPTPKPPVPEPPNTGDATDLRSLATYAAVGGAMVLVGMWGLGRIRRNDASRG